MSRIGDKIKKARIEKNMDLKQLAKLCGVSQTYMADVESGKRVVNDSMIKRISKILDKNLDEPLYMEEETVEEPKVVENRTAKVKTDKIEMAPGWESAFSNIIKDIPVYDMDMSKVTGYRHFPVMDRKVEGHNPDKLIYITMADNSMSGFRLKKGDRILVLQNPEIMNNGLCFIEYDGKKAVRQVKRLDGDKILLLSHYNEVKTDTRSVREIKVIGHCLRAEIDLNMI